MTGLAKACDRKMRCLALLPDGNVFVTGGGGGISISEFIRLEFVDDKSFPGLLITVDVNSGTAFAGSKFSDGVFSFNRDISFRGVMKENGHPLCCCGDNLKLFDVLK